MILGATVCIARHDGREEPGAHHPGLLCESDFWKGANSRRRGCLKSLAQHASLPLDAPAKFCRPSCLTPGQAQVAPLLRAYASGPQDTESKAESSKSFADGPGPLCLAVLRITRHLGNVDRRTGACCSGFRAWNTEQCFQALAVLGQCRRTCRDMEGRSAARSAQRAARRTHASGERARAAAGSGPLGGTTEHGSVWAARRRACRRRRTTQSVDSSMRV